MREIDAAQLLRERGLRVTPQRRAILEAFVDRASEHLSADEVHARAAENVPELGRGTVYSALAELTELGVLAARGSADPVRYELDTGVHQHFRCRLCMRLFDVELPAPSGAKLAERGYAVERIAVEAEGICAECAEYDAGLVAGAQRARSRPAKELPSGAAASSIDTPLGPLALAATPDGIVRVVFPNHADVPQLAELRRSRRGGRAARAHVDEARDAVSTYFEGRPPGDCAIDWGRLGGADILRAATAIPSGGRASYEELSDHAPPRELGRVYGQNPVAILIPCHRVMRGREVPREYVGGPEQRQALLGFEKGKPLP
jgi:Fur family ferric uptake transcriptional regulator